MNRSIADYAFAKRRALANAYVTHDESVDCRLRKLRYAPCVADMCW